MLDQLLAVAVHDIVAQVNTVSMGRIIRFT